MKLRRILHHGFGDAGCKIGARMRESFENDLAGIKHEALVKGLRESFQTVAFNTNQTSLDDLAIFGSGFTIKLVGEKACDKRGAGTAELAAKAFEESKESIFSQIDEQCDIYVPTFSLGKWTGTTFGPQCLKYAIEKKKLVLPCIPRSVLYKEVSLKKLLAQLGYFKELNKEQVRFFQINNDLAFRPGADAKTAYDIFDEPLAKGLVGLVHFFASPAETDLNDALNLLTGAGRMWMNYAEFTKSSLKARGNGEIFQRAFEACAKNRFYETNSTLCESNGVPSSSSSVDPGAVMFFVQGLSYSQYGDLCEAFRRKLPSRWADPPTEFFTFLPNYKPGSDEVRVYAWWSEKTSRKDEKRPVFEFDDKKAIDVEYSEETIASPQSNSSRPALTQHRQSRLSRHRRPGQGLQLPGPTKDPQTPPPPPPMQPAPASKLPVFLNMADLLGAVKRSDVHAIDLMSAAPETLTALQREMVPFLAKLRGNDIEISLKQLAEQTKKISEPWKIFLTGILHASKVTFTREFDLIVAGTMRNKIKHWSMPPEMTADTLTAEVWWKDLVGSGMQQQLYRSAYAQTAFGPGIFMAPAAAPPPVNGAPGAATTPPGS